MFTVTWTPSAEEDLAFIWVNADSSQRREINSYTEAVIRNLRANADRIGESRESGVRILAESTLGVEFRVSVPDRLVTVFRLWPIRN